MGHRRDHEWLETFEGDGADRYDAHSRWLRGMHQRTATRLATLLPPGGRLLDVGAGPGRLLAQVAELRPDAFVTGVDRSQRMVELAGARLAPLAGTGAAPRTGGEPRARALLGDVAALPVPDDSADVVSAVLTAHHWDDLRAGFAEIARVLTPGGSVLVVEMRGPATHVARAIREAFASSAPRRRRVWVMGLPLLVGLEAPRSAR